MEHNGQAPQNGPVVVTGATGGVGSIAIDMLAGPSECCVLADGGVAAILPGTLRVD